MSAAAGASTTGGLGVSGTADASTTAALRDAIARLNGTTADTTVPDTYAAHRDQIAQIATEEGVPASLLGALVWSESGFDQNATSSAGARGLAQLMPATADGLGVDIDDPTDNLRGGARYLRNMLDRFGRTDLALAAYNAGPNAVTKYGGVPPYRETQTYVTRVLARATTLAGGTP
jgi:soluble lytic murein transglycosylase-like protein